MAFGVTFYDGLDHTYEKENIQKYVSIELAYMNFDFAVNSNGVKVPTRQFQILNFTQCQLGRFRGRDQDMIALGLNQPGWFCPSELDVTLIGQLFSSVRANLRFTVNPCVNASNISDNDPNACAP